MNTSLSFCPHCQQSIVPTDNFCPRCGFDVRQTNTITIGKQLYIYAVSLIAPPFGLIWTFKYLNSSSGQRTVGLIAGALTILSFLLTLWWAVGLFNSFSQQLNSYSQLGF